METLKRGLKRAFRRPVLAFANGLEKILMDIQNWLDGLTIEQKQNLSKVIGYPAFALFLLIMFMPYLFSLFNFIKVLSGGN